MKYPLLRSLDPYHQRIGYLGTLATLASRGLETHEALASRYHDLLFEKIYPDEPRFHLLLGQIPSGLQKELTEQKRSLEEDPSAILSGLDRGSGWVYLSEFWIRDECMPSPIGWIPKQKLDRTIQLAHWTNILSSTNELSEVGFILKWLLSDAAGAANQLDTFNLLNPTARTCLPLLYLRIILSAEMLFPYLVAEFVDRDTDGTTITSRGENGLLRASLNRAIEAIGEPSDPEDILAIRDWFEFRTAALRNQSTEENYLRPRLEILVDLGLIDKTGMGNKVFTWQVSDITRELARQWRPLATGKNNIPQYLDREFFQSMSVVFGTLHRPARSPEERLLWFTRALNLIGREFGFTPGRTVALLACLMAWEEGVILEIDDLFDVVYSMARSEWSRFFQFSGGSRFDREFLIRMDKRNFNELEAGLIGSRNNSI